jgi:sec-independent protein translocase protein TatB
MFFNVGGAEILVIAVIALIVVGPEQLPGVLRKVGRTMAQVRTMAAGLRQEFMAGLDEAGKVGDVDSWFSGSGEASDPVVRPGYAEASKGPSGNSESSEPDDRREPDTADGESA